MCRHSILSRAESGSVSVYPLKHRELRRQDLFKREWAVSPDGQYYDRSDGRPFSTEFSHSRFLVPALAKRMGLAGWVMFVDCDFLFLADVRELLCGLDPAWAAACVKHDFRQESDTTKMDGVVQQAYFRKLWSSLLLLNLGHPDVAGLTPYQVNMQAGSWLHALTWVRDDGQIGGLPEEWNWIPGHSPDDLDPKAVHFSFGGVWLGDQYADVPKTGLWVEEYRKFLIAEGLSLSLA